MSLDRTMYEALAGLLKASILIRVGGASKADLEAAEKAATKALATHHREYVEGGPSSVALMVMAPMLPPVPTPSRDKKGRPPKTGRGRASPSETAARNEVIRQQYREHNVIGKRPIEIRREIAGMHGISEITVDHIVNGYGIYRGAV